MGTGGTGEGMPLGLLLSFYYCSEPMAKTSLDLEEAGLEENVSAEHSLTASIGC